MGILPIQLHSDRNASAWKGRIHNALDSQKNLARPGIAMYQS